MERRGGKKGDGKGEISAHDFYPHGAAQVSYITEAPFDFWSPPISGTF
jgi:hypothetical protein